MTGSDEEDCSEPPIGTLVAQYQVESAGPTVMDLEGLSIRDDFKSVFKQWLPDYMIRKIEIRENLLTPFVDQYILEGGHVDASKPE